MIQLNPEKRALASVVGAAALVALTIGIIWPTVGYISKINRETYDLRVYLEKKYENVSRLKNSVKKIDEIKAEAAAFPQYLFHSGDELKLITILENLATENKMGQRVESSNLDKITDSLVRFSLVVTGDYQNFFRYLRGLEKLGLFLNVERLYLVPTNNRDEASRDVSAQINFTLYVNN